MVVSTTERVNEMIDNLNRGMFISGQFIGNYDYNSKYPELINQIQKE